MPLMNGETEPGPQQALAGVRVLDLSRVLAGPWCTQTLADLGADVIKVERPPSDGRRGGDDTRGWGPPFLKDQAGNDTAEATYYLATNRNKRSITVDIARPEGQALLRRMALQCDVFIENFKVGDMARHGLDAATLAHSTRGWSIARSRGTARPARTATAPATTMRSRRSAA